MNTEEPHSERPGGAADALCLANLGDRAQQKFDDAAG